MKNDCPLYGHQNLRQSNSTSHSIRIKFFTTPLREKIALHPSRSSFLRLTITSTFGFPGPLQERGLSQDQRLRYDRGRKVRDRRWRGLSHEQRRVPGRSPLLQP